MSAIGDRTRIDLKTVVYATDFTHCSENAGLFAARIASFFSASLLVAHMFTISQAAMEIETESGPVSQQRKDLESLLSKKVALLKGLCTEIEPILLQGDPRQIIPELADRHQPSMIALGTHGRGQLSREFIGSVAEQILRSSNWPVLTVGPQVPPASSKTFPFRRILFATDFSPAAASAIPVGLDFAEAMGATVDLLHVIPRDHVNDPTDISELQSWFRSKCGDLLPERAREFSDPRTFVPVGSAYHRILEHIEKQSIDLLLLGIRKTSHLGFEMRTSGAFRLIVNAACPVLTILK
ncbi:MAG TPA: universal stress protein [Terracidiphilus sp.]|nr:universal stress protein [Terracidiphilus sp.]